MHFLTKRAGWKGTKVHKYYTFEQEPFKKKYILGNQKAKQEAVARGDDVQANFWKLLNNANFGFDCRDNSQNKSLHLIYNKQREVDFISKYGNYNANNCLLNLDSQIENVNKYNNVENREENKNPYAEILKEEEIESIKERFSRRQKKIGKGKIRENLFNVKEHLEEAFMNKAYTFVQELEEEDVNIVRALAFKK